jgi:hypothetical protein
MTEAPLRLVARQRIAVFGQFDDSEHRLEFGAKKYGWQQKLPVMLQHALLPLNQTFFGSDGLGREIVFATVATNSLIGRFKYGFDELRSHAKSAGARS